MSVSSENYAKLRNSNYITSCKKKILFKSINPNVGSSFK